MAGLCRDREAPHSHSLKKSGCGAPRSGGYGAPRSGGCGAPRSHGCSSRQGLHELRPKAGVMNFVRMSASVRAFLFIRPAFLSSLRPTDSVVCLCAASIRGWQGGASVYRAVHAGQKCVPEGRAQLLLVLFCHINSLSIVLSTAGPAFRRL